MNTLSVTDRFQQLIVDYCNSVAVEPKDFIKVEDISKIEFGVPYIEVHFKNKRIAHGINMAFLADFEKAQRIRRIELILR